MLIAYSPLLYGLYFVWVVVSGLFLLWYFFAATFFASSNQKTQHLFYWL